MVEIDVITKLLVPINSILRSWQAELKINDNKNFHLSLITIAFHFIVIKSL